MGAVTFMRFKLEVLLFFFFSSRRRHTRYIGDWSSDVCSSDLDADGGEAALAGGQPGPHRKSAARNAAADRLRRGVGLSAQGPALGAPRREEGRRDDWFP